MKVLLDESVPVQVRHALPSHEVRSVVEMGWRGLKNGQLLDAAEAEAFDLVITADKNLRHQQNFSGRRISMLELWTNNRPILERHFARIRSAVEAQPAKYTILDEHTQSTDEPPSR